MPLKKSRFAAETMCAEECSAGVLWMKVALKNAMAFALIVAAFVSPSHACEQPDQADCPTIEIAAAYTGDLWRNVDGGIARGGAYLDNFDLLADLDPSRWLGWSGLKLHAHLIYNNGRAFSGRYVGNAQVVSNIEAVDSWRLYEFWAEYGFGASDSKSVRVGLYDLNSEFNALDASGLFLNSSHGIGAEIAQTGLNGPSIFPVPGLALRVRGQSDRAYWQVAALDAVPGDPDHPERTSFHLTSDEGALLALEVGGEIAGFNKLALGAWSYTADFESIDETDSNGDPLRADGNRGFYLLAEKSLWANGESTVNGFLRAGTAASRFNPLESFIGFGVSGRGWLSTRADDEFGIALAHVANSARQRQLAISAGAPVDRSETTLELTWRAPINDWLVLQPDVQYVVNPGTSPELRNAWAIGLRFEISTSWSK